ncbi:YggS family pyridoxal phosphate-dependent enzyme [Streptomyces sioyaensis]|uniref:Pyridoxal phosphate homeostasis protein n=1 Tax=Streptomyces sioyaensis TaxID=67364 RepID=A0A4Q1R4I6_9ACTN|nr:YggS family pyridoxal phosphate-dependent enzyme [Streptomyces sioyaensis]MBM4796190.1 YggS family pyridoxal phosphate-dependent enzyme [Streptomyces sioyaensis]RXS66723.1 YggS family pyridoxal phosphate-dependent enzyme [Streptomyces sioyaensis]RXS85075.1 YggS family pyridoxal phosphate-dependent enzyme [Streptomyces sp. TM32]
MCGSGRPRPGAGGGRAVTDDRRTQLAQNLAQVEERISAACAKAGRPRADVTLIVVTKTYPASDVRLLAELGVRQVAENRDQEAAPKAAECGDLPLNWHFVGQLQTNKVRSVAGYAGVVQSVDRARLATALSREAVRAERELGCLIQVALDAESGERGDRGGVAPDGVEALAETIAGAQGLRLDGVMTVAPLAGPYAGRELAAFERLMEISSDLRGLHPAANMVSAGMSADLEDAVAAGATHVRVGTAVLGVRPRLR